MSPQRIGVYPGSFDPVTNGHMDIISRAAKIFDKLIVAVALNVGKNPVFTLEERLAMVEGDVAGLSLNHIIEVTAFEGLLMDFAKEVGAGVVIRGLRAVSDFEYEFQMAGMNARLNPKVETAFLMASDRNHFISSRFVKEIGALGGDVSHFVSPKVAEKLVKRFSVNKAINKD